MIDEITPAPPIGLPAGDRNGARPGPTKSNQNLTFSLRDPRDEDIPGNKFAYSPSQLARLITDRRHESLQAFGGVTGLAAGLRTDVRAGLGADEDTIDGSARPANLSAHLPSMFTDRRQIFGENRVPRKKPLTFLQLLWLAFNDKLMFLLTASAAVSLALGIYQTVRHQGAGPRIEWVEGVSILAAVIIIVLATAGNDYQKNYKFQKLNQKKEERNVTVIRSGEHRSVSIYDLVVGDVVNIEAGDVAPADGLLLTGFDIQYDESSLTGESDLVDKIPTVDQPPEEKQEQGREQTRDPFILSGTQMATGVGTFLVLCVGGNSSYGRLSLSLQNDVEETPLQQKLGRLAGYILKFGLGAGLVFFIVMFIRFLTELDQIEGGPDEKAEAFLELFILSITVVVIGVPEGLPLTVTLALAFATTRMLRDKNLVRLLRSCETMGNATTVCSDKTGTLTQNNMSVIVGRIGSSLKFASADESALDEEEGKGLIVTASSLNAKLDDDTKTLLKASIALNSTAIETDDPNKPFVGSSTETALLKFGVSFLALGNIREARSNLGDVVQMVPFDASRKWMASIIKLADGRHRVLVKGAAEVIIDKCTKTIALQPNSAGTGVTRQHSLETTALTQEQIRHLHSTTSRYAQRSLRVVALAYRDFEQWPPRRPSSTSHHDSEEAIVTSLHNLTFISALGIRDIIRPEVPSSVRACRDAGVLVRMVTGDNMQTAIAVASECGIYTPGGLAMDGPTFRRLTTAQLDLVAPRLQILARSSPDDKLRLVRHLRSMNEIVAVTGDGTNDALALKAADVGFSMGISGTEVAKEASAIVLIDDNFASIVKAISWGRAVNDATKKFLQFQFTINFTAGILTVVSAFAGGVDASVFAVVQLLWINLIMDTFAALALATDWPTASSLTRRPEPRTSPVFTTAMWKMVFGQSVYQLAVIFTMHYAGMSLSGYEEEQMQTLTFNTYVWMQVFNQWNSRCADNRFNIFEGVHRNPWFWLVQSITIAGQIVIVVVGGAAFQTTPLTGAQWGWTILFGALTLPLGVALRLLPDSVMIAVWRPLSVVLVPVGRTVRRVLRRVVTPARKLKVLIRRRGKSAAGSSESEVSDGDHRLGDASALTLVPPVVGSGEEFDLAEAVDSQRFGTATESRGLEVHPNTPKEDPILVDFCSGVPRRKDMMPPSQNPECLRHLVAAK